MALPASAERMIAMRPEPRIHRNESKKPISSDKPVYGQSRQEIEREITATLGRVPRFFSDMPDWGLGPEWESFRQAHLEETALPRKTKELIALAVAGALGSEAAAYLHSRSARALGASAEEIAEAAFVAMSTAGLGVFLRARGENSLRFKAEADEIVGAVDARTLEAL